MDENNFVLLWEHLTVLAYCNKSQFWKKNEQNVEKVILDEVSGAAKNGTLVAVLGPSGAGKTTLLRTLAGKINRNKGTVAINGNIISNTEMKYISGFLHQHLVVVESLTVREHLTFMNALKSEQKNKNDILNNLIFELSLETCVDTCIRNISGGEKKKLALAVELLGNPKIIYCDEVTTGLDSTSANTIIGVLSAQARLGKLIITSIHQPSSQLYNYFNEIILLNKGQLVYQGNKQQTKQFFEHMNLIFPTAYNPADFYIYHITQWNRNGDAAQKLQSVEYNVHKEESLKNYTTKEYNFENSKRSKPSVFKEICWLIWRSYIDTKRNFGYHLAQFGLIMATAFIITVVYSDINAQDNAVQNIKGLLFFITSELIFSHLYAVIFTFPEEYNVFLHDESLYSCYAYFISKIVALIPKCIIQPLAFLLIISVGVRFVPDFFVLFQMYVILFAGCMTSSSYGLSISSVFQSLEVIELLLIPLDLLSMVLAGILVKVSSIPIYFRWLRYMSPFYYVYESISILQWSNTTNFACTNTTDLPCYTSGTEILTELGFHTNNSAVLINILGMFLLFVFFCLIGYLGILRKQKKFY